MKMLTFTIIVASLVGLFLAFHDTTQQEKDRQGIEQLNRLAQVGLTGLPKQPTTHKARAIVVIVVGED